MNLRIAQGLDVHPFDETRPLILGGLRIAERGGLAGHSDADAVLHAITDCYLGAIGAGDIGVYFPSTDERWRDCASAVFVEEACRQLSGRGGALVNIDVTIVAQKPKLAPFRDAMRENIARLLRTAVDRVSVKATTTDHLGFIGREEGVAVLAVALFEFNEESK